MNFKSEKNETNGAHDFKIPEYLKDHPFVAYLKIYKNQHKIIHVLYQGLIFSFSGFLVLISFLIYNALDSSFVPWWGGVLLGFIDALLLFGVIRAVIELKLYRIKSQEVLLQMIDFIQNESNGKLQLAKGKQDLISETKKKFSKRIEMLTGQKKAIYKEPYKGWDVQECPKCDGSFEMTKKVCPFCHHGLVDPKIN